jgi:hypothetical protein
MKNNQKVTGNNHNKVPIIADIYLASSSVTPLGFNNVAEKVGYVSIGNAKINRSVPVCP